MAVGFLTCNYTGVCLIIIYYAESVCTFCVGNSSQFLEKDLNYLRPAVCEMRFFLNKKSISSRTFFFSMIPLHLNGYVVLIMTTVILCDFTFYDFH